MAVSERPQTLFVALLVSEPAPTPLLSDAIPVG